MWRRHGKKWGLKTRLGHCHKGIFNTGNCLDLIVVSELFQVSEWSGQDYSFGKVKMERKSKWLEVGLLVSKC